MLGFRLISDGNEMIEYEGEILSDSRLHRLLKGRNVAGRLYRVGIDERNAIRRGSSDCALYDRRKGRVPSVQTSEPASVESKAIF